MKDKNKENYFIVPAYSVMHFIVDLACAYLIYQSLGETDNKEIKFIIYNFCAFALQMPFGLLADRINRNALCAMVGCGLVAVAYFVAPTNLILTVMLAGIGNGLFHIGGGIEMLNRSKGKAGILGVFVSPGAAGIYLGTIFGKQESSFKMLVVLLLIGAILMLIYIGLKGGRRFQSENKPIEFPKPDWNFCLIPIVCFGVVVILRSYLGMTSSYSWKAVGNWGIVFVSAVVLGKMLGGFLADWIGAKRAAAISLGVAAICFIFADNPWCGIIAVFFFQMTMPITLWAIAKVLHHSYGFAFGILTFGLFLGSIPVYFGQSQILNKNIGFAGAAILSLLLLLWGLHKLKGRKE